MEVGAAVTEQVVKMPSRRPFSRRRKTSIDDVLQFLVSRGATPSAMGAMLQRMRDEAVAQSGCKQIVNVGGSDQQFDRTWTMRVQQVGDVYRARDAAENAILRNIPVIRCIDGLVAAPDTLAVFTDRPALARLSRNLPGAPMGQAVVWSLRVYQEWASVSQERGLATLYSRLRGLCPQGYPVALHDEETLAMAFAQGKAKLARRRAAELYADCLLVLSAWVNRWNKGG